MLHLTEYAGRLLEDGAELLCTCMRVELWLGAEVRGEQGVNVVQALQAAPCRKNRKITDIKLAGALVQQFISQTPVEGGYTQILRDPLLSRTKFLIDN